MNFRQNDEKVLTGEVIRMKWNPKIDLVALVLKSGEVCLHRLANWQKVWSLPAIHQLELVAKSNQELKREINEVCDIEWKPDGRFLAIAYAKHVMKTLSTEQPAQSSIALVDVENAEIVHVLDINGDISSLCWGQQSKVLKPKTDLEKVPYDIPDFSEVITSIKPLVRSLQTKTAPVLPVRKTIDGELYSLMRIKEVDNLNVLAVGTTTGQIQLFSLGMLLIGTVNLPTETPILHMHISEDLSMINVLVDENQADQKSYKLMSYRMENLAFKSDQYYLVSAIYARIVLFINYIAETLRAIQEAWDDILLEIDSKLSGYTNHGMDENSTLLADEFMELLVFGTPSSQLERFLQELTDKGIRKLGNAIEAAYNDIQKYLVLYLQPVGHHLINQASKLKGISLWDIEFGDLGLQLLDVNELIKAIGGFHLKVLELQQVIDMSLRNVKSFFRWLYTTMIRLYNESAASATVDIIKISQQDLQLVGEFIEENFDNEPNDNESTSPDRPTASNFTLERVGQYLKNEDLTHLNTSINNFELNPWIRYLRDRPFFPKQAPQGDEFFCLFPHNTNRSLIQEQKNLDSMVDSAFKGIAKKFPEFFQPLIQMNSIIQISADHRLLMNEPRINSITLPNGLLSLIALGSLPVQQIYFVNVLKESNSVELCSSAFAFEDEDEQVEPLKIVDFGIFDADAITVLLNGDTSNEFYLAQVPMAKACAERATVAYTDLAAISLESCPINRITISLKETTETFYFKKVENLRPNFLVVSGPRKVVTTTTARRVRIYDVNVPSEEEETTINEATMPESMLETTIEDVPSTSNV